MIFKQLEVELNNRILQFFWYASRLYQIPFYISKTIIIEKKNEKKNEYSEKAFYQKPITINVLVEKGSIIIRNLYIIHKTWIPKKVYQKP